jgi:hypothetical protein
MTPQTPEDPATRPTQLFFPVMSTLIFIGLAIYELPGLYGWIYLAIAIFGMVTVYLSWQGNKRKRQARSTHPDPGPVGSGDQQEGGKL